MKYIKINIYVKTVGMLLALSALPMGAVHAGTVTSHAVIQNVQAESECKGVVFDATGEPVIGASVVVKGKNGVGTVTDIDGNLHTLGWQGSGYAALRYCRGNSSWWQAC